MTANAVQSETAPAMSGPLMPERLLADLQLVYLAAREPREADAPRLAGS